MHRPTLRRPRLGDLPLLMVVGGFVAWYLLLGPSVVGGPATYVVVSGTSMEPTLHSGDLVIARKTHDYAPGDIVAFRVPGHLSAGGLVIHRVVGGSGTDGFMMQGDNRMGIDPWRPMAGDIVGEASLVIPNAGSYLTWLREPGVFASLAAGLTVFIVLLGGRDRSGLRTARRLAARTRI